MPEYTAITFAPVQGFIENSRKLRDLYGSSYLLSFLSRSICLTIDPTRVISPALPNIIQGLPNVLVIEGILPEELAQKCLQTAWSCIVKTCQAWIEQYVQDEWTYCWNRSWQAWCEHTWEIFYAKHQADSDINDGQAIQEVRRKLNEVKRARDWTGINWRGESSTLTGTDAIAYPEMECVHSPEYPEGRYDIILPEFYQRLRFSLGDRFIQTANLNITDTEIPYSDQCIYYGNIFIDEREELSIPDIIKRLITHLDVIESLKTTLPKALEPILQDQSLEIVNQLINELIKTIKVDLNAHSFKDLNRLPQRNASMGNAKQNVYWTGWFMGDGDEAGKYLKSRSSAKELTEFSQEMREWGSNLKQKQQTHLNGLGRVIYAGGDDFMGVLYKHNQQIEPEKCLNWLVNFKPQVWEGINGGKPITPSVGFIWVSPSVPQRDLLQHCRLAEKDAKKAGKDRVAIRIVFSNGNTVQWICPWRFLPVLYDYCDRNGKTKNQNWTHLYNDIAVLESRHAFTPDSITIAQSLFNIYFKRDNPTQNNWDQSDRQDFYSLMQRQESQSFAEAGWWNRYSGSDPHNGDVAEVKRVSTGLLGDRKHFTETKRSDGTLNLSKTYQAVNGWVINLAKIGFHLCK
jgi:CRISPR-associated protein Cmr2